MEVQVKGRDIKSDKDCFKIKDFTPRWNFFIICHNIHSNDFFCMPSKTFFQNSEGKMEQNKKKRKLSYSSLIKHDWCKNEKGLSLLKKALKSPKNKVSGFLDKE